MKTHPLGTIHILGNTTKHGDAATRWINITHTRIAPIDSHPLYALPDHPITHTDPQTPKTITLNGTQRTVPPQHLVIRLGLTYTIQPHLLQDYPTCGQITTQQLQQTRAKYLQLINGKLDGPEAAWESQANPDYHNWINKLARNSHTLITKIRGY
jgi:hypothetical protein